MRSRTLVKTKRYAGQHVALESFNSSKVVAHGSDPSVVLTEARSKGYAGAVMTFVPKRKMRLVYPHAAQ